QNKVSGTVDNTCHPLNAVRSQTLAHGFNNGDSPGNCCLKGHHHAFLMGGCKNLVAVLGQHCLVGSHNVFTLVDGLHHPFQGHGVPTNELDHNVNIRMLH